MANGLNLQYKQKQSLQLSLKLWLPILQAPVQELDNILKEYSNSNPFLEYQSSFESSYSSSPSIPDGETDRRNFIENMNVYTPSLYDRLEEQIDEQLFPTPNSQKVAHEILYDITKEGFFEGDIAQIAIDCNTTETFVESIRQRFRFLDPKGIGAIDLTECFLFQLQALPLEDELYKFTRTLIENLSRVDKYAKHHHFEEGMQIIKGFNNPPAIEYLEEEPFIIPDFFVEIDDDIHLRMNNDYYPDISVKDPFNSKNDELKAKLKEARDLTNLLQLRKSTLYKLVLMIVERQIGFFLGHELKPLTMSQIAKELGFEESTISRAVANKYIKCERGTFAVRSFFTNAVSKDLSSSEIKSFISGLIENESHEKPLTDQNLVDMVMQRYNIKMVRRTITKYRKLLEIPSSKERKRLYTLQ
ncbi:MAG TPA: RNA polymerase factor sigma-54 [Campylobacterales bacterium]|nr:RNA polymerase factor sigma-54 [Campylobacterales bacterium]